eukprot:3542782-Rhodomonas_salina.3
MDTSMLQRRHLRGSIAPCQSPSLRRLNLERSTRIKALPERMHALDRPERQRLVVDHKSAEERVGRSVRESPGRGREGNDRDVKDLIDSD